MCIIMAATEKDIDIMTFFCNRTIEVHFFSNKPFPESAKSCNPASSRIASAVFAKVPPSDKKYSRIAWCLQIIIHKK